MPTSGWLVRTRECIGEVMIIFTNHVRDKLTKEIGKLGITERTIAGILRNPDELLYDALRDIFVASAGTVIQQ